MRRDSGRLLVSSTGTYGYGRVGTSRWAIPDPPGRVCAAPPASPVYEGLARSSKPRRGRETLCVPVALSDLSGSNLRLRPDTSHPAQSLPDNCDKPSRATNRHSGSVGAQTRYIQSVLHSTWGD